MQNDSASSNALLQYLSNYEGNANNQNINSDKEEAHDSLNEALTEHYNDNKNNSNIAEKFSKATTLERREQDIIDRIDKKQSNNSRKEKSQASKIDELLAKSKNNQKEKKISQEKEKKNDDKGEEKQIRLKFNVSYQQKNNDNQELKKKNSGLSDSKSEVKGVESVEEKLFINDDNRFVDDHEFNGFDLDDGDCSKEKLSFDYSEDIDKKEINIKELASKTGTCYISEWIDLYEKANRSSKKNSVADKMKSGRFRITEDHNIEILADLVTEGMTSEDLLNIKWC